MRITPVTGDLPAVATAPPPPLRHLAEPPPVPVTPPVARASATGTGVDPQAAGSHRPPNPEPFFDPPLIAQRAALGLPTGFLIADFARAQGVTYAAVAAAVEREMPTPVDPL